MGLTQQPNAVETIQTIVNFLLLRGDLGRPGAGVCPVRGHSNVQGDRTMGIFEKMPDWWLDRLDAEFGLKSPRTHGLDTVDANRALGLPDDMRDYTIAVQMLHALGVTQVRVLTNNPTKIGALESHGIHVVSRESIQIASNVVNHEYLVTKKHRMGHLLDFDTDRVNP
jgi:anaerobic selenocysteine-containing dehydrogenase